MKEVDEGIFLHRTNYSESSLILTLFTKRSGLRKFIFKGGKKKAHNLYPLSVSEITYFGRKESELLQLTNAEAVELFEFPFDPVRSTIAFFIVEILRKCIHEGERDEKLYAFIRAEIEKLEHSTELAYFPLQFLVGFSEILGFLPMTKNLDSNSFHLRDGRIDNYSRLAEDVETGEHIRLISVLINKGETNSFSRENRDKAMDVMLKYYSMQLPGLDELKTLSIVKEVLA